MTFLAVSFDTTKSVTDNVYCVAFKGDNRYFSKLNIHVNKNLGPAALDIIELYGIWCYISLFEFAGTARNSRNLNLTVSRPEVQRVMLGISDKTFLFPYSSSLRAQLFGLESINLDMSPGWSGIDSNICIKWDGSPPLLPEVLTDHFGGIKITHHALSRYFDATKREGRVDGIYAKVAKLLKASSEEFKLDDRVLKHKKLKHLDQENTVYLKGPGDWFLVVVRSGEHKILKTIYMRSEVYR